MKQLIGLALLVPNLAWGSLCTQASPLEKNYQSQKTWKEKTVRETGVSLAVSGFVDDMNNFFPEEQVKRITQTATVKADPSNGDASAFRRFCKKYDEMGNILTAFRASEAGNRYHVNVKYLPSMKQFNNDPFQDVETSQYKVFLEVSPDSLIGRQPLVESLKEQIIADIEDQLTSQTPVGEYHLTLTNWDDFACDMIQGKVKLSIMRDMHSKSTFVSMEERIPTKDVRSLYSEWASQLEEVQRPDELMFTAGVVFQSLKENGRISEVDSGVALQMVQKLSQPGKKGIDALGELEQLCLASSLQDYEAEFTRYEYNVVLDVDKQESLQAGE